MTYMGMPLGAQFKKTSIWTFFNREDGKETICLKEIIFIQGRQTYFVKKYPIEPIDVLSILICCPQICGT